MAVFSKTQLVKAVADELGFNQTNVKEILDAAHAKIAERADAGDTVSIAGFGRFQTKDYKARVGRHPGNGALVDIPASRRLTFKATKPTT
ncbi:HU family DNA-binding protein [Salipiger marinus]|uniref:HU family DNA-binding protein n=1 Tax=Salipiger marinus TaxID=555512 RepID=UPI002CF5825C|nr:HU family DNA-binding protein [Salipiger manganoxidans]MEB3417576.1 HU family DNA-binding protein [Salipiger manganoxidans]